MNFIKTPLAKELEERTGIDFTPTRATVGSAGYDLRAAIEEPITIYPDEVVKIPTGVKVWIGSDLLGAVQGVFDGTLTLAGELLPRSSTSGAILNNTVGVVDADYQQEIFIKLRNITPEAIIIDVGERFAQVVFKPVYIPGTIKEVIEFDATTTRTGGFGSTGK